YGNETLGEPFQENLRSLGILIEQGSGGGEQQDEAVARMRAHRLFGLWQKPRGAGRIGEGGHQDLIPSVDRLRLMAEGQNRLCRRSTRHAKSFCLRLRRERANRRHVRPRLPGRDLRSSGSPGGANREFILQKFPPSRFSAVVFARIFAFFDNFVGVLAIALRASAACSTLLV